IDFALVVIEPTLSGIHDAERVIEVAKHFRVPPGCVINKYDINRENSVKIEKWCKENEIPVLGKIPFDNLVSESIVKGIPFVEYKNNATSGIIKGIWRKIMKI
ncbi:(4Fe-4S)-binding protein, partial [candidate division WOR-3 bacterium]|nr:(4Fe-4S)-binding protein [candidate division WOR-3 bacterium]